MPEPVEKPPLGIAPRFIHDQKRVDDLLTAIERYCQAGKVPKAEWATEVRELIQLHGLASRPVKEIS